MNIRPSFLSTLKILLWLGLAPLVMSGCASEEGAGQASKSTEPAKSAKKASASPVQAEFYASISKESGLSEQDVASVFAALNTLMEQDLKGDGAGEFTIPGLVKFSTYQKRAVPARKQVDAKTGKEKTIPAKPARRMVRAKPLKDVQQMIKKK